MHANNTLERGKVSIGLDQSEKAKGKEQTLAKPEVSMLSALLESRLRWTDRILRKFGISR